MPKVFLKSFFNPKVNFCFPLLETIEKYIQNSFTYRYAIGKAVKDVIL